jgi:ATP-dependent Lhr-like helicase
VASLSKAIGQAFYGQFRDLREVQRDLVAPLLEGSDVLVLSPTGSGKTEGVLAPLVQRNIGAARSAGGPVIVHVTPTRALANDLLRRLEPPLESLGLSVGIRHGERNDLKRVRRPDLLITTPESLDVMLSRRSEALREVNAIVLDEVHLTYNTQRGLQLAVLIERLERVLDRALQVVGMSATVARDTEIWRFFRPGRPFVTVMDAHFRPIDAQIRVAKSGQQLGTLLQRLSAGRRFKVLVFVDSRRECDTLAAAMSSVRLFGGRIFVHHAALGRDIRLETEKAFQDATSAACVATSTLELGIDIGDIDLVALYGYPGGWESFLQRVGRGNRRGEKANALCLAAPGHGRWFFQLLAFEALIWQIGNGRLEREPAIDLYGAAAQQIMSVLLERQGGYQRVSDLAALFHRWPHLGAALDHIVEALVEAGYLQRHGFLRRVGAGEGLHQLEDLGLIWGNFPLVGTSVSVLSAGRELGAIPMSNVLRLHPGVVIRFAGRQWRVRRVRNEAIEVEPATGGNVIDISYGGRRAPLDPASLEAMLLRIEQGIPEPQMPSSTARWFKQVAARIQRRVGWGTVPYAFENGMFHYFTFAGRVMNQVLARWAAASSFEADEVVLRTRSPIDFARLPVDPAALLSTAVECLDVPDRLTVFQQLLPTGVLARELAEVWLKSPVYGRSLERLGKAHLSQVALEELAEINL